MALQTNTWTDITCPADCDTELVYPAIAADQTCGIVPQLSQIIDLFITPDGATIPFTISGSTASATAGAIDNTVGDNTKTFRLYGKGSIQPPEKITYEAPEGAVMTVARDYTLEYEVVPTEAALYNWLRHAQCGNTNFTFGYANVADQLFYQTGGIKPKTVDVDFTYGAGATDFQTATLRITFRTLNGDPPRFTNPL